jgi:hypothetical protein
MNFPQFEVVPFVYAAGGNTSTGYLIQMITNLSTITGPGGATTVPSAPLNPDPTTPNLGYANYPAMISALSLAASINFPGFPYSYVVGTGANNWTTDALAKAAAIADCNKIAARRDVNIANSGINANNPYVTLGAPILGPL